MCAHFKKVVKLINEKHPTAFPTIVRRTKLKNLDGYCQKKGDRFIICISKDLDEIRSGEVFLHEYAHAISWSYMHDKWSNEEFQKNVHNASWGIAYAEVYRTYEENLLELEQD